MAMMNDAMKLYDYKTGEFVRDLSTDESKLYMELSDNGKCAGATGVVDGATFGHEGSVYAE